MKRAEHCTAEFKSSGKTLDRLTSIIRWVFVGTRHLDADSRNAIDGMATSPPALHCPASSAWNGRASEHIRNIFF